VQRNFEVAQTNFFHFSKLRVKKVVVQSRRNSCQLLQSVCRIIKWKVRKRNAIIAGKSCAFVGFGSWPSPATGFPFWDYY